MKDYSDKSFWLAKYGDYTPNSSFQGEIKVDIAIIGGGYTGLSTGYNLRKQEPGMTVAVLEGEVVGFGASGWFVNRKMIPWPPEPLRMLASQAILGYLHLEDSLFERNIAREA